MRCGVNVECVTGYEFVAGGINCCRVLQASRILRSLCRYWIEGRESSQVIVSAGISSRLLTLHFVLDRVQRVAVDVRGSGAYGLAGWLEISLGFCRA